MFMGRQQAKINGDGDAWMHDEDDRGGAKRKMNILVVTDICSSVNKYRNLGYSAGL